MKALIHRTTFLFFFSSNSIPPPLSILQQQQPGEIGKLKYLCNFYYFLPRFGYFFDWANQKKLTTICIPTDGNFPIFENSTLSGRRKSDLIFPCIFSRIRYTVTFCSIWPHVISFHSTVELRHYWSTFPIYRLTSRLHL